MEKIEINHFKAFGSRLAFIPKAERKNLLIYGENGSGKTSVYEAIRLIFYYNRMLKSATKRGASAEEIKADEETFYNSYDHRQPVGEPHINFTLAINDTDFKSFNAGNYQCFMLSNSDLDYKQYKEIDGKIVSKDILNIKRLLGQAFFPDFDIEDFLNKNGEALLANVNQVLEDDFIEDFKIGFANDQFDVSISDTYRNLNESNGLHKVFNEAKINLVVILLYLETVRLLKSDDAAGKHRLLVLDDLITSLDSGNRLFFANYFLTKFDGFQKILFTHNVGFNNLIVDRLNEYKTLDNWHLYNLYLTVNGPQSYSFSELRTAIDIRNEFDKGFLSPASVGVEIRKRFEADINEIAKMFQLDATSRAMDIISDILLRNDRFYFRKHNGKLQDSNDLVSTIDSIIGGGQSDAEKLAGIGTEINNYHTDADVQNLVQFIKEFHYYERIIIHSMAHGTAPMPTFIQKEVYAATHLLEQIEDLKDKIKSGITTT